MIPQNQKRCEIVEQKRFQKLLAGLVSLSASQRRLLKAALHGEAEEAS